MTKLKVRHEGFHDDHIEEVLGRSKEGDIAITDRLPRSMHEQHVEGREGSP